MFTHRNENIPKVFIIQEEEMDSTAYYSIRAPEYSVFGLEHVHSHT